MNRKAFTVLELAVVIAILALCVLLLVPAVMTVREVANRNKYLEEFTQGRFKVTELSPRSGDWQLVEIQHEGKKHAFLCNKYGMGKISESKIE